jgi:predicted Rossmann fold nucleotide-binding protein DprA/Smf involved in DNA uptake
MQALTLSAQATLLLCGTFGRELKDAAQPLTPSEFNRFSEWLSGVGFSLPELLEMTASERIVSDSGFDRERIVKLLSRGSALALSVERWTNLGIWIICRDDEEYPERLRGRLKQAAPPLLYGAGNRDLLLQGGLAVVGSRDADEPAMQFAHQLGETCAAQEMQVISGGAKGIDSQAMHSALNENGRVIGVLADSLAKELVSSKYRTGLLNRQLTLISPYAPEAPFNVGNAMGRNKCIYALADFAIVVSSSADSGGTWSGAKENLKHRWVPLFIRSEAGVPDGNRKLIKSGGIALDPSDLDKYESLEEWLTELAGQPSGQQPMQSPSASQQAMTFSFEDVDRSPIEDPVEELWPRIEKALKVERTAEELADEFHLSIKEIRGLLKRAVELGKVRKVGRPARYVRNAGDD